MNAGGRRFDPAENLGGSPRRRTLWLVVLSAGVVCGCNPQQKAVDPAEPPPLTEKVKIGDLADKPTVEPEGPTPAATPGAPGMPLPPTPTGAAGAGAGAQPGGPSAPQPPQYRLTAQTVLYPRHLPALKMAARMIDTGGIDPATLAIWQANGFGLGRLDRARLPMLTANLPRPLALEITNLQTHEHYLPLTLVDRIQGAQRLLLHGRDQEETRMKLTSGKCNLLLRLVRSIDDPLAPPRLDLMPQHHTPLPSIMPRGADRKDLDGTPFLDLRLDEPIDPTSAWIIWLADAGAGVDAAPPSDSPTSQARKDARPVVPASADVLQPVSSRELGLAEVMLTGRRGTTPVQLMVVIVVDEAPRP
jgi:hypothetical protein